MYEGQMRLQRSGQIISQWRHTVSSTHDLLRSSSVLDHIQKPSIYSPRRDYSASKVQHSGLLTPSTFGDCAVSVISTLYTRPDESFPRALTFCTTSTHQGRSCACLSSARMADIDFESDATFSPRERHSERCSGCDLVLILGQRPNEVHRHMRLNQAYEAMALRSQMLNPWCCYGYFFTCSGYVFLETSLKFANSFPILI